VAAAAAVGAGVAALAAGRVVSERSVRPGETPPAEAGGLRVHSCGDGQIELTRSWEALRPGHYGLEWGADGGGSDQAAGQGQGQGSGRAVVGEVMGTTGQTVVRRLENGVPPPVGTAVRITPRVLVGDPSTALGLDFTETRVSGELGPMPAWYLSGARDLWVLAVHGLGEDRQQVLPLLPVLTRLKIPVLALTYRNDAGAPRSPDGLSHFGEDEWRDVEAAMRLALAGGAGRIVLLGWSIGATTVLQTLHRSPLRDSVRGVVLDSPVLDLRGTVHRQAARRGVPDALAALGARAAEGRSGVDSAAVDRLALGRELRAPLLLMHSPDDTVADVAPARRLAADREDLVMYREFPGAEHAALWNSDPTGYEDTLRRFLTPLL
jgi:dienelactone hydrolase